MDKRDEIDARIATDLRALAGATARRLPTPAQTEAALRRGLDDGQPQEQGGTLMDMMKRMRPRRLLTGLCAAAAGAALLVMPVSYERTVGHEVKLTVSGQGEAGARALARQARAALQAEAVRVSVAGDQTTLALRVPARSRAEVERRAGVVVREAQARGVQVAVSISPRREQVQGRVYAMALDKVIEVRVDMTGKTQEQIEAEIRAQLQAGGINDPSVAVSRTGDQTRVEIGAEVDGPEGTRHMRIVRQQQGGEQQLELRIGDLDTRREPGMTDDQLREKIERQLRERGLEPDVKVTGDRIEVRAHKKVD